MLAGGGRAVEDAVRQKAMEEQHKKALRVSRASEPLYPQSQAGSSEPLTATPEPENLKPKNEILNPRPQVLSVVYGGIGRTGGERKGKADVG